METKTSILPHLQASLLAERTATQQQVDEELSRDISNAQREEEARLEEDYPVPPEHGLQVHAISFAVLQRITSNFMKNGDRSKFLGSGGFAEVYLGNKRSLTFS
jgi:hypothetical protein